MKIKENLILVEHRELTGFIDLGGAVINTLNFEKKEYFGIHALSILSEVVFQI